MDLAADHVQPSKRNASTRMSFLVKIHLDVWARAKKIRIISYKNQDILFAEPALHANMVHSEAYTRLLHPELLVRAGVKSQDQGMQSNPTEK